MGFSFRDLFSFSFYKEKIPTELKWIKLKCFLEKENINFLEIKNIEALNVVNLKNKSCLIKVGDKILVLKQCEALIKDRELFDNAIIFDKKYFCLVNLKNNVLLIGNLIDGISKFFIMLLGLLLAYNIFYSYTFLEFKIDPYFLLVATLIILGILFMFSNLFNPIIILIILLLDKLNSEILFTLAFITIFLSLLSVPYFSKLEMPNLFYYEICEIFNTFYSIISNLIDLLSKLLKIPISKKLIKSKESKQILLYLILFLFFSLFFTFVGIILFIFLNPLTFISTIYSFYALLSENHILFYSNPNKKEAYFLICYSRENKFSECYKLEASKLCKAYQEALRNSEDKKDKKENEKLIKISKNNNAFYLLIGFLYENGKWHEIKTKVLINLEDLTKPNTGYKIQDYVNYEFIRKICKENEGIELPTLKDSNKK